MLPLSLSHDPACAYEYTGVSTSPRRLRPAAQRGDLPSLSASRWADLNKSVAAAMATGKAYQVPKNKGVVKPEEAIR